MRGLQAVGIVGAGLAVPERRLTNEDLTRFVDTTDEWIRTRTGILSRHLLADGATVSDLAVEASRQAISRARVEPHEIDAVLVGTVTADMPFPNVANVLQHRLGLRRLPAFDLSAACAGYVYGLVQGTMMIQTGRAETVLVVGADALSRLLDWRDRGTCVLFGDGAGATILRPVEEGYGLLGASLGCDGSGADLLKVAPREGEAEPYLQMAGREVFKFAVRIQAEACQAAMDEAQVTADQIDLLIPHQANIRIIESASRGLGIPMERVYVNVDKYGNTSAASIPLALAEALEEGRIQRGDRVMLVGFGGGLTWGAAVLRWQ